MSRGFCYCFVVLFWHYTYETVKSREVLLPVEDEDKKHYFRFPTINYTGNTKISKRRRTGSALHPNIHGNDREPVYGLSNGNKTPLLEKT